MLCPAGGIVYQKVLDWAGVTDGTVRGFKFVCVVCIPSRFWFSC